MMMIHEPNVQSEQLIKDENTHSILAPKFLYKLTCSLIVKLILEYFQKIKLLKQLSP